MADIMTSNAKRAGQQVDVSATKIYESDEVRQSNPFAALARDTKKQSDKRPTRGSGKSFAMDADTSVVCEFLDLDMTMPEALESVSQRLVLRQKDHSRIGFWSSLRDYFTNCVPADSLVRDCNPVVIARSLQQLAANVA